MDPEQVEQVRVRWSWTPLAFKVINVAVVVVVIVAVTIAVMAVRRTREVLGSVGREYALKESVRLSNAEVTSALTTVAVVERKLAAARQQLAAAEQRLVEVRAAWTAATAAVVSPTPTPEPPPTPVVADPTFWEQLRQDGLK